MTEPARATSELLAAYAAGQREFAGWRVQGGLFSGERFEGLLVKCRQLLALDPAPPKLPAKSVHERMLQLTGIDITRCPLCQKGTLVFLSDLPVPIPWDSS
jgi:hypothetical protein